MKLTPIIFIVLAVGIFFLYVQPQNERFNEIKKIEQEYKMARDKANELRTKREGLQNKFKQVGIADQERLKKMLPDTIDNVRLLLDLTNIANRFGISPTAITISSGQEVGAQAAGADAENKDQIIIDNTSTGYGTIKIGFSFVATYEDYKRFLRELELSLRLIDIKQLTVRTSETPLNSYSIIFETYWLR